MTKCAGFNVIAAVLTFRRPRLAGQVVRGLLDQEGFDAHDVLLVVNGEGGLDDAELEHSIRVLRLPENVGPAGGFAAAMQTAFEDPTIDWVYLCEDDVGLFNLPTPRVGRVLEQARQLAQREAQRPLGAVVAYAWDLNRATGHATPHVVQRGAKGLVDVDTAAWGATLVSRRVIDDGILPDARYFMEYEDFDFFYRLRGTGHRLVLDEQTADAAHEHMTNVGRDSAFAGQRPTDAQEPWRAYYVARNFFFLYRRHGRPRWLMWHLLYTIRRLQLSKSGAARVATLRGLWDGLLNRRGKNRSFERSTGEYLRTASDP